MCHSPRQLSIGLHHMHIALMRRRVDINTRVDDVISPCCGAARRRYIFQIT
jgi:hypothetical protein